MTNFALARRNMVEGQLRPNRVNDAGLLAAEQRGIEEQDLFGSAEYRAALIPVLAFTWLLAQRLQGAGTGCAVGMQA